MGTFDTYENLRYSIENGVCTLTINRPNQLNALNKQTKKELRDFFRKSNERDDYSVIILTGEGGRAFCAGTDVKEMQGFTSVEGEQLWRIEHELNEAIRRCSKPVIAAVNGHALGSGFLLTITCDYSVVSDTAKLGFPEIKVGVPSAIEIALLPKIVGIARSREIVFFGDDLSPKHAYDIGLINKVVPADNVLEEARKIAEKFKQQPATVLRLQKEIINHWIESDFNSSVESSIYAVGVAFSTDEPSSKIKKFLEKE